MGPATLIPLLERKPSKPAPLAAVIPSRHSVKKQLSIILESHGFLNAPRMKRFLKFIVEETLAGRSTELCEYTIGVSVFDRDESFQPCSDPIVRNDARRLRLKLLEYYQHAASRGNPPRVFIEMPKGSYVPTFKHAARLSELNPVPQYRLNMSLIRISDNAELWRSCHEY
jgi:hypothetical protein